MNGTLLIELAATWELQAETGGDGLNKLQPPARETLRACADTIRMLVGAATSEDAKVYGAMTGRYLRESAPPPSVEPASADSVPMPQNEDQAALMALLGSNWLRENAPHRLSTGISVGLRK